MADLGREPALLIPGLVVLLVLMVLSRARPGVATPRALGWSLETCWIFRGIPLAQEECGGLRECVQNYPLPGWNLILEVLLDLVFPEELDGHTAAVCF